MQPSDLTNGLCPVIRTTLVSMPKHIGNWPVPIEEILGQGGKDEASSLAYVNAPDFDSDCRVTVRLVDKKTKRERTVVATSTEPEWVRVAVGSGRIASSSSGSHPRDTKTPPDDSTAIQSQFNAMEHFWRHFLS